MQTATAPTLAPPISHAFAADVALLVNDEGGRYVGFHGGEYIAYFDDETSAQEFRERATLLGAKHALDVETRKSRARPWAPWLVTVKAETLTETLIDIALTAVAR